LNHWQRSPEVGGRWAATRARSIRRAAPGLEGLQPRSSFGAEGNPWYGTCLLLTIQRLLECGPGRREGSAILAKTTNPQPPGPMNDQAIEHALKSIFSETDLHARRVLSLSHAVLGAVSAAQAGVGQHRYRPRLWSAT
jgi:hypothetical protein